MHNTLPRFLILLALLGLPAAAFAHAFPEQTQPQKDSTVTLQEAPSTVKIWFTEQLEPLFNKLVVKNADGTVVTTGKAVVGDRDSTLLKAPVGDLAPGTYHVHWQVTSKDGHRTHGSYTFTVSGH